MGPGRARLERSAERRGFDTARTSRGPEPARRAGRYAGDRLPIPGKAVRLSCRLAVRGVPMLGRHCLGRERKRVASSSGLDGTSLGELTRMARGTDRVARG